MSPEFGSTCAIFPIDAETLRYLEFSGRPPEQIELVEAYAREQGLFHEPGAEDAVYSEVLELDLGEPLREYVRGLTADPDTVAVVVLPELVVRGWTRLLHNQRALYVKRLLLFEPRVILASVPYQLR